MEPLLATISDGDVLMAIQVIIAAVTLIPLTLKIISAASKEPKKAAIAVTCSTYPGFLLGYGINNDWIIGVLAAIFATWTVLYFVFH
jgi:hypothetical protein